MPFSWDSCGQSCPTGGERIMPFLIWVYMAHKLGTDRPTKLIKTADFENSQAVFSPPISN